MLHWNKSSDGANQHKILLAFSGAKHCLRDNPGYNCRVAECQEAAEILLWLFPWEPKRTVNPTNQAKVRHEVSLPDTSTLLGTRDVTVLESHDVSGGVAHSFEIKGYKFDSGPSLFSGFHYTGSQANPRAQIYKKLILERLGTKRRAWWRCSGNLFNFISSSCTRLKLSIVSSRKEIVVALPGIAACASKSGLAVPNRPRQRHHIPRPSGILDAAFLFQICESRQSGKKIYLKFQESSYGFRAQTLLQMRDEACNWSRCFRDCNQLQEKLQRYCCR
ncbi:hypothetical protein KSP39_PZI000063 [Platanthera zijinensis]|uniref:Uncharacterized protein n=1 Tax=Platanthera zijinensis TaxID=2320716 RepID=A0AAP0C625_9ASPA